MRVLLGLMVLAACSGPPPDAPQDPATVGDPAAASDPAEGSPPEVDAAPVAGWVAELEGLPRPEYLPRAPGGDYGGPGFAYTAKYGPHSDDYPGPGAVVGTVPDATLHVISDPAQACSIASPAVVEVKSPQAGRAAFVDGATLVVLDGSPEAMRPGSRRLREDAASAHLAVRVAITSPPDLLSALALSTFSELVRWSAPTGDQRLLLHRVLREVGKRPLVTPPDGMSDDLFAQLLVDGATFWLDDPLPPKQKALLKRVRERRDWFRGRVSHVAVLIPAESLAADPAPLTRWLAQAARELERSHLAWRPTILGDGRVALKHDLSLLHGGEVGVLSPPASLLTPSEGERLATLLAQQPTLSQELPEGFVDGHPRDQPVRLETLDAAALVAGLAEVTARPSNGIAASFVPLPPPDLPAGMRMEAFVDPEAGRTVLHLLGDDSGGRSLRLGGVLHRPRSSCDARVVHPWTGESAPLDCGPDPDAPHLALVVTPPVDGWAVIEVDRRADADASISTPWKVDAASVDRFEGRTVTLRPPASSGLGGVSLSMPEWFKASSEVQVGLEEGKKTLQASADGRQVALRTESAEAVFEATIRGVGGGADLELSLTNRSDVAWDEVRVLICASRDDIQGAWPFPEAGQERVRARFGDRFRALSELREDAGDPYYVELSGAEVPVTELTALDGRSTLAFGMDASDVVGGNANHGICLHARPQFGRLHPREKKTVRGRLRFEAKRPSSLFSVDWAKATSRNVANFRDGWVAPCSAEGVLRRAEVSASP